MLMFIIIKLQFLNNMPNKYVITNIITKKLLKSVKIKNYD